MTRTLSQVDTRLSTEITNRAKADAALDVRLKEAELAITGMKAAISALSPSPIPVVPPPPDPVPPAPGPPAPATLPIGGDHSLRGVKAYTLLTPTATVASPYGLAEVNAARAAAGVGGVVRFPAAGSPYAFDCAMSVSGQTWQLATALTRIDGRVTVMATGCTLEGGKVRNVLATRASIAPNFTLRNVFVQTVSGYGVEMQGSHNGWVIKNCEYAGQTLDFIKLWYDQVADPDLDGFRVENCIMVSPGTDHSAIAGNDGNGANWIKNFVVTNCYIDAGAIVGGHGFGVEVWHHALNAAGIGGIVEFCDLRGGGFLISMVRSIGNWIHHNRMTLGGGGAYAAYEAGGSAHTGAILEYNLVDGTGGGAFVYHDAGSHDCTIRQNKVTDVAYFLQGGDNGGGYTIQDNCYSNVGSFIGGGGAFPTPNVLARNGPLEGPCHP